LVIAIACSTTALIDAASMTFVVARAVRPSIRARTDK
jgi:hypothetical protein